MNKIKISCRLLKHCCRNVNLYNTALLVAAFSVAVMMANVANAQTCCRTNSLVINTGYNPNTGAPIAPGANGGTPMPDSRWFVCDISPALVADIAFSTFTAVTPTGAANVITPIMASPGWVVPGPAPAPPCNWISCFNSNFFSRTLPAGTSYNMTLCREFRLCEGGGCFLQFMVGR